MKKPIVKDMIICLVGLSGTGKSTIAKRLVNFLNAVVSQPLGQEVCSFTTRESRGKDDFHIFVSEEQWQYVREYEFHKVVAYTQYGHHHYWVTKDQFINKGISVFVVDPNGVECLKKELPEIPLYVVHIVLDEKEIVYRLSMSYNPNDTMSLQERIERNKKDYINFKGDVQFYNVDSDTTAYHILKWLCTKESLPIITHANLTITIPNGI